MVEQVQSFGPEIKSGQEPVRLQRRPDGLIEVRTSRDI